MFLNPENNIQQVLTKNAIRLEEIIIAKMFLFSLIPIIKSIKLPIVGTKKQYKLLSIPIICNSICVAMLIKLLFIQRSNTNISIMVSFISAIILISSLISLFIFLRVLRSKELSIINNLILNNMNTLKHHYISLNRFSNGIKLEYNTNNEILDLVLEDKKFLCDHEKIKLEIELDFSSCSFISDFDICNIFSNLIDNAIDACKTEDKVKNRIIKIVGRTCGNSGKMYVLKIEASKLFQMAKEEFLVEGVEENIKKSESFMNNIYVTSAQNSLDKFCGNLVIKSQFDKLIMIVMFTDLTSF